MFSTAQDGRVNAMEYENCESGFRLGGSSSLNLSEQSPPHIAFISDREGATGHPDKVSICGVNTSNPFTTCYSIFCSLPSIYGLRAGCLRAPAQPNSLAIDTMFLLHINNRTRPSINNMGPNIILSNFYCLAFSKQVNILVIGYLNYLIAELILQSFLYFIYVTAHSPTLPLLRLHHSSLFRFSYLTGSSLTSPGDY